MQDVSKRQSKPNKFQLFFQNTQNHLQNTKELIRWHRITVQVFLLHIQTNIKHL